MWLPTTETPSASATRTPLSPGMPSMPTMDRPRTVEPSEPLTKSSSAPLSAEPSSMICSRLVIGFGASWALTTVPVWVVPSIDRGVVIDGGWSAITHQALTPS